MSQDNKGTILELNTVQTTGTAGESIASGIIFTLPAMIFLGYSFMDCLYLQ